MHAILVCVISAAVGASFATAENGYIGQPTLYQSPRFRWWLPGGWIEPDEITNEINSIINAGFGGGEIADVQDSVKAQLDPQIYGWAQPRWNDAVLAAHKQAQKLGGHIDLTIGPHWPTGFPGYTPDCPETMKELVHGQLIVNSGQTFTGLLPLPKEAPSGNETGNIVTATPRLVTVVTARTNATDNSSAEVIGFDPKTVSVLSEIIPDEANQTVTWTAPDDGNYILVAAYCRGTGQIQNMYDASPDGPKLTYPYPAYIVDHFSAAGVEAGIKYYNEHILSPALRSYISEGQGSLFEDSLELKTTQYWTLNLPDEFKRRRGYDLFPFIFYVIKDTNTFAGDDIVAAQIANDFYQTISDLYTEYRLEGLKTWANELGLRLRIQPYTVTIDSAYAASIVDIPEGESLGFEGDDDAFRVLAAGRDVAGLAILSDELGAYMNEAYGVTWSFLLGTANANMALGVNQVVIHGFPYQTSPTSLWPGFAPFTPLGSSSNGFADAWGPRQPHWMFATNASLYLANSQMLLQSGQSSVDVAIINMDWGVTATWEDTGVGLAGYSYQFPSPELLLKHNVTVENGRLAPKSPAYKALVVKATAMDVKTAQLLLSYANAGLPIILVEPLANQTYSYFDDAAAQVKTLSSILDEISSADLTKTVSDAAEVPEALSSLGVQPSIRYGSGVNGSVATARRSVGSGYLYWIYNGGDASFSGAVSLEGEGQPLSINLWTGTVTPLASFFPSDGYVSVNITLGSTAAVAIYVGPDDPYGAAKLSSHLTSTDCNSYTRDGTVYISSSQACSAVTSSGKTVLLQTDDSLPEAVSPSEWTLSIEDWGPAAENETGLESANTKKTSLPPIKLTDLVSWHNISAVLNASGIGVYTATVSLTLNSTKNLRVLLDTGYVGGTWGIRINGNIFNGVDLFSSEPLDVTELVKNGCNDLQITVATTLWNKLIQVWPDIYGSNEPEEIGLVGPVTFTYVYEQSVGEED